MPHEHRVAGHLGVEPDEYDRTIRTFIPHYDRMLETIVHWLAACVPADGLVVDLGAGTGALSAGILDGLPQVRVQLVDVDSSMLDAAARRCAAYARRIELRHGRFQDELPRCDAVVATLALHHVPDHDEKRALFQAIHAALGPGGLLAAGDLLIHPEGPERRQMLRDWYAHMAGHGITGEEADAHFVQWSEEDHYVALTEELALIGAAGFARPECFWRDGGITVYGAFKD
ncbi:MAG TPA: methyltransferase [Gaiella sp.]|nr:methyltransferase [Gaiella sp.]